MTNDPAGSDLRARRTSGLAVALTIARRELLRFRRQPTRVAAAIGTPLIVWILMGSGFSRSLPVPLTALAGSPQPSGTEAGAALAYSGYLLPGMMTLVAMFTAIFSTISIIDDRQQGWLQSVLVSPAPRWSIALGKILGGSVLAFGHAAVLLPGLPILGLWPGWSGIGLVLVGLALTSLALTGIGVAFAWRSETSQGFHAVMNLLLMPMWLLSGAFFPADGAAKWLSWVMRLNPLTWCTDAVRGPMFGEVNWPAYLVSSVFAVLSLAVATFIVSSRRSGVAF